MSVKEFSFISANSRDNVQCWRYTPLGQPRGIIQLIHGFGEHSRRYFKMIEAFLDAGYVVYADDHIGHGKTASLNNSFGDPGQTRGYLTYIEDEHQLHNIAVSEYPDLPYFIFGHSWGSLIARAYASDFGDDIKGLMLCGLCAQMQGCINEYHNNQLKNLIDAGEGFQKDDGTWFNRIFSDMNRRIPSPHSSADWIAKDQSVVEDHASDPYNCMAATLQLLNDFVQIYGYVASPEWPHKVNNEIPCYLISGDQDPCGNYGEGTYHVANALLNSGQKTVKVKVYPGGRHEIHNEADLRDDVIQGLVTFLNECH